MSKRDLEWNESKYNKYLKEGRGKGTGSKYIPWVKMQDFPSLGRTSRIKGIKSQRIHHLFSDNETRCFYIFDWSDKVVDIQEQYPLLDLEMAKTIAEKMNVIYPRISGFPIVMTTDFLITIKDDFGIHQIARTVKPARMLDDKRVIEKYEIERRYWLEHSVDWGIVTEKEIPTSVVQNIQFFHPFRNYRIEGSSNIDFDLIVSLLRKRFELDKDISIQQICVHFDKINKVQEGTALSLFKYLVAKKEIRLDITKEIDLQAPLKIITIK